MGIMVGLPSPGGSEKDLQLNFGKNMTMQVEVWGPHLPAEWRRQSGIQLTWPHEGTDWADMLPEVQACFIQIASAVSKYELVLIVTPDPELVKKQLSTTANMANVRFFQCDTNDTWARDHGAITMMDNGSPALLDFTFNGWGEKFPADLDNQITHKAVEANVLHGQYIDRKDFVLEGGSIESDGMGTLLTTSKCLLSPKRNDKLNKVEIEEYLRSIFHMERVLWLDHGHLTGDDTDGHIDTLARFCTTNTIAYVSCDDKNDEQYEELKKMERQLETFGTLAGDAYRLVPLPMPDKIEFNGERLPATYANFLIINDAVLYPTYNQPENDRKAYEALKSIFTLSEVIGIDCTALIKQHGSLHCITMQYPLGVIK
mgnify:CR=1 FL=1